MANFETLQEKAKSTIGAIADVSVELYKVAEEKVKLLAKITKISSEISREKSRVRKRYGELGSAYYDAHKEDAEDGLKSYVTDIADAYSNIADKQLELNAIRAEGIVTDADIEEAAAEAGIDDQNEE